MSVMPDSLHIETFCLGDWMTNCYVVHPRIEAAGSGRADSQPCWIVDAGFDPDPMIDYIQQHRLQPQQVVLTHAHVDHIAGLHRVCERWPGIPILIHTAERDYPADPALNLSIVLADPLVAPPPTGTLEHGQILKLGDAAFEVRHTPGHSPGGVVLYQPESAVALVGDTLFGGSVGRSDFPTSDQEGLFNSIRTQLYTLPDETRVLPGHGPATTIGQERATNPFVQG